MSPPTHPAPADVRPHAPWPTWRKVLAYVILGAAAAFGIWLVDVKSKLGEQRGEQQSPSVQAQVATPSPLYSGEREGVTGLAPGVW
jgi:hypothetical protein